jgi:hypothetical protein
MIYVKMLNVHRWQRTWSGLVIEPDTIGELKEIRDGLFSVLWPGQVRTVLCLPNTLEVVEERRMRQEVNGVSRYRNCTKQIAVVY